MVYENATHIITVCALTFFFNLGSIKKCWEGVISPTTLVILQTSSLNVLLKGDFNQITVCRTRIYSLPPYPELVKRKVESTEQGRRE